MAVMHEQIVFHCICPDNDETALQALAQRFHTEIIFCHKFCKVVVAFAKIVLQIFSQLNQCLLSGGRVKQFNGGIAGERDFTPLGASHFFVIRVAQK
jgi:hypothetical protein